MNQRLNILKLVYKKHLQKYGADKLKDYPLMRQFHSEAYGYSWPFFDDYEKLLEVASKNNFILET